MPVRVSAAAFAVTLTVLSVSGCSDEFCDIVACTSNDGGGGGSGGSGGGVDPGCVPSNLQSGESIPPSCGVFVEQGKSGDGSPAAPLGSLAAALASVPEGKSVYVCGASTLDGDFELPAGRSLFGGLACSAWTYDATLRPTLSGAQNVAALRVTGMGTTRIEDVQIVAPNATSSSIGLFISKASVALSRVSVTAGDAGPGASGTTPASPGTAASGLGHMCAGGNAAAGGMSNCGSDGGVGGPPNGGDGGEGSPMGDLGGDGGAQASACNMGGQGQSGGEGGEGDPGMTMQGEVVLGTLVGESFVGDPAPSGGTGISGGGGGGGKGSGSCGGSGGGAGGCGGGGGGGGTTGGASFAIAVFGGALTLVDVSLTSGTGGTGGNGAEGGPGGTGGGSTPAGVGACAGGTGGAGGQGGPGAAGHGGPSALVALQDATAFSGRETIAPGLGDGGEAGMPGANGATMGGTGSAGLSCEVLDLVTRACVTR